VICGAHDQEAHISVAIEALGNTELKGKVVQIVPAADPASRAFLVKIELPPDTRLRSGLFGRAQFLRGERQALLIPRSAVVERGQLQGVFVLDQNKVANLRYVTLGKSMERLPRISPTNSSCTY
jgi:multidrug efflux pump subunit AcrA (membrane-fusion protein)